MQPQLIITTSACHPETDIPVLVVNPFLTHEDIDNLQLSIDQIEHWNTISSLNAFFMPELYFHNLNLKTPEDIISLVSRKLVELNLADDDFEKNILRREKISSTVIQNNIAIPHPLVFCARQTCIPVVTLPRAIDWFGKKAQFIFFLAINNADRLHMEGMYRFIVELSDDAENLQRLLKADSFEKLMTFINRREFQI